MGADTVAVQMKVSGMMCSFCTMSIERALKRYAGVKSVMVNLVHGIVLVEADTTHISRSELATAVEKLGSTCRVRSLSRARKLQRAHQSVAQTITDIQPESAR